MLQRLQGHLHRCAIGNPWGQYAQHVGIPAMQALPKARVGGGWAGNGRLNMVCDLHAWHWLVRVHRTLRLFPLGSYPELGKRAIIPATCEPTNDRSELYPITPVAHFCPLCPLVIGAGAGFLAIAGAGMGGSPWNHCAANWRVAGRGRALSDASAGGSGTCRCH